MSDKGKYDELVELRYHWHVFCQLWEWRKTNAAETNNIKRWQRNNHPLQNIVGTLGKYYVLLLMKLGDSLEAVDCDYCVLRNYINKRFPKFSTLLSGEIKLGVVVKGASLFPSLLNMEMEGECWTMGENIIDNKNWTADNNAYHITLYR